VRTRIAQASGLLLCWCLGGSPARAQAPLPVLFARANQVRIDGELGDWSGAHFIEVGEQAGGRAEVALAYDAFGLYFGARVFDDKFVRSDHPGPHEDALVMRVALPEAGEFRTSELWLFAGKPGQTPASLQLKAAGSPSLRPLPAAKIVEAPSPSGYLLEAFAPWAGLPAGAAWPFVRGSLWLQDVDAPGGRARLSSEAAAGLDGQRLPLMQLDGGPVAALNAFLRQKDLQHAQPLLDWVGDVRGDAGLERVMVIGTYLVVSGSAGAFSFSDLPAAQAGDVREPRMIDLTGDARPELVLRLRSREPRVEREIWRVFDLSADPPRSRFAIETRRQTPDGALESSISIGKPLRAGPARIEVRAGRSREAAKPDVSGDAPADALAIGAPSGAWLERVYAWDGHEFALQSERANPAFAQPSNPAAPEMATTPTPSPSLDALLEAYRAARGVPAREAARFVQQADLAGDARVETLAVLGRECVVVGEGFRSGRDFFYFGLPVQNGSEIISLYTADVTGDHHQDVFARVRQDIGPVSRELLIVYTFRDQVPAIVLEVEVSRAEGATRAIANDVGLVKEADHLTLQIGPGVARGWTRADYPFSNEAQDGVAPLLLPWKDGPTRYRYDGQRLVPRGVR
jgi:hypothetical protein